ncbi:MAG TPA: HlyD family efflux transporter periplasmic adaptor subunit [Cytophagales bacterium]|nr:HlyD family efflux transporter periplasmic adaptor subunit [Cytophagales bacterium]
MKQQLFPKEIIEYSAESHFYDFSVSSKVIYLSVLLFLIGAIASLPFIYINISVKSNGLIRPLTEKNIINSPVSGRVKILNIKDNLPVTENQTLLVLESPIIEEQIHTNRNRAVKITRFIDDLRLLINKMTISPFSNISNLKTTLYDQSYLHFQQQLSETNNAYKKAEKEFKRNKLLFNEKVISRVEYDNNKFNLDQAATDIDLLVKSQTVKWQSDLNSYQRELTELEADYRRFQRDKERYVIKAPLSGTIQNFIGIYSGSFIHANQKIAEISPDSGLIVECYVTPADIGLIKKGSKARFQIDAFNYNEWGIITGKITDISNDIIVTDGQPLFKIKCSMDKNFLELENGYVGKVKKGMTLRARFLIAERSLFQLLYDNVDDWLNPNRKKILSSNI